jgi:DNA-binding protein HU-beta
VNKADLIEALTERMGDKKTAAVAVEALVEAVTVAVAKGEKVAIAGFGVFEKVDRAARTARNPATGATVKLKETSVPKFRPGQGFKDIVSGAKKMTNGPLGRGAARGVAAVGKAGPAGRKAAAPAKAAAAKATPAKAAKATAAKASASKAPARTAKAMPAKASPSKTPAKTANNKAAARTAKATPAKASASKAPAKTASKKAAAKRASAKS